MKVMTIIFFNVYCLQMLKKTPIFWEKAKITGEYSDQLLNKINEKKYME